MKIHPVADKFPILDDEALQTLADDIRQNGQLQPIVTHNEMLIDGRNRLRACEIAGVEPQFIDMQFGDELEIIHFIISANIRRRHLDKGQKAMLGEDLRPALARAAKERQEKAGSFGHEGGRGNKKTLDSDLSQGFADKTEKKQAGNVNAQIGLMLGVGGGTVATAQQVAKNSPELAEKVRKGEMSLNAAYNKMKGNEQDKTISSMSRKKLDSFDRAVMRERKKMQAEFDKAVQEEMKRLLDETVLPQYHKERNEYRLIVETRKGIMTREIYRLILSCLHPDRVEDPKLKEKYTKAFHAFSKLEVALCDEKELPTNSSAMPRTFAEMMKRKKEFKQQRQNQKTAVRPRAR